MASRKTIGLGLIGAGLFATMRHLPALLALDSSSHPLEIRAVYSLSTSSATNLAQLIEEKTNTKVAVYSGQDLERLYERNDIDAVDIVLPITSQPLAIQLALQHRKHVMSEKPVASDVAQGLEFIEKYEREFKSKGLIWCVAENYVYEPALVKAAEIVKKGELGRLFVLNLHRYVSMNQSNKYFHTKWRQDAKYQGGYLLDGGVHDIAAFRLIAGEITQTSAFITQFKIDLSPSDTMASTLLFASGAVGTYSTTFTVVNPTIAATTSKDYLTIIGEKGSINLTLSKVEVAVDDGLGGEVKSSFTFEDPSRINSIISELAAFIDALQNTDLSQRRVYDPRSALQDVAVIEAMIMSSQQNNHCVPVPNVLSSLNS